MDMQNRHGATGPAESVGFPDRVSVKPTVTHQPLRGADRKGV